MSIHIHETTRADAFTVHGVRRLTDSVYVLTFDRGDIDFSAGQYVSVGPAGSIDMREYSVYSSPSASYLEILVKEVPVGSVSKALGNLAPGAALNVDGPFGFFTIDDDWREHRYYFIATGTGISPFHSFVSAYPDIDYQLIHGVRYDSERYELEYYDPDRLVRCISREDAGDYHGRVTDRLREMEIDRDGRYYLCGNCDMIYEAFDILQDAGVPHAHLFAEVYF